MKSLTTKEVAERTGFSLQKIRALIKTGRLPAVDSSPGKRACWLIREQDLIEFLTPYEKRSPSTRVPSRKRIDSNVEKVW